MIVYNGTMDAEAYRGVFGRVMTELCAADRDVVYLDCDLTNSIGTRALWKANPRQAVNCGVAEANMAGIAAGLSAAGKKPYAHTFGPFATRRCYDQLFLSVAYGGRSLRLFGSDPGVTAAFNGGTHMPFEDMALIRAIPGSTVIEASDAVHLEWVMRTLKDRPGLTYVRTTRKTYPALYSRDHALAIGKGEIIRDGKDATVIACGLMVGEALKAAADLEAEGVTVRVVDMHTIKPLDADLVAHCARDTGVIVAAENHNVIGGLADAVAAALLESGVPARMGRVGVRDVFGSVGPQDYLQDFYGLTAANVAGEVRRLVKK